MNFIIVLSDFILLLLFYDFRTTFLDFHWDSLIPIEIPNCNLAQV